MKYIIHIVLVFLLLNVSVKALSLKEAVNDSLSNNLSLKIEAINVDMAEEDYLQSTTDYFPTITLSGSMSENDYSDIKSQSGSATNGYELSPSSKSIVLSQNVFSGFSRFYSSLSTKEQLHIQNLTQSKVTQDIILETIDAYYNVLLAQKIVQSNKDNFNSVSERFNATSKEFEVGLASKTDVAQSDAFLNNSKFNCFDSWQKIETNYKRPFLAVQNVRNLRRSMPYKCNLIYETSFKFFFHQDKIVTGKLLKCEK